MSALDYLEAKAWGPNAIDEIRRLRNERDHLNMILWAAARSSKDSTLVIGDFSLHEFRREYAILTSAEDKMNRCTRITASIK